MGGDTLFVGWAHWVYKGKVACSLNISDFILCNQFSQDYINILTWSWLIGWLETGNNSLHLAMPLVTYVWVWEIYRAICQFLLPVVVHKEVR